MKKKQLLFKIHSLEEHRKELFRVLKNTQLDFNDYIAECKKLKNTVAQQQKLINEQKELIDELLNNKSNPDSKQKLIECLTSSFIEKLNEIKSLKESKYKFYYHGKEIGIEWINLYIKNLELKNQGYSIRIDFLNKKIAEYRLKYEPKRKKFLGIF
jgi:hypothetical protein